MADEVVQASFVHRTAVAYGEVVAEMRKVTWPDRAQLKDTTIQGLQIAHDLLDLVGQGNRFHGRWNLRGQVGLDVDPAVVTVDLHFPIDIALGPAIAFDLVVQFVERDGDEELP